MADINERFFKDKRDKKRKALISRRWYRYMRAGYVAQGAGTPSGGLSGQQAVLLMGQSNMRGRRPNDNGPQYPAGTLQWSQAGTLIPAVAPLDHSSPPFAGSMGPALQFAIAHKNEFPNADVVFIPCAIGNSGFSNNQWNPGDPGYEQAVSRANAFFAANPSATPRAVLWHQGETDAEAGGLNQTQYAAALDAMIASLRTDVPAFANTIFIAGQIYERLAEPGRDGVNAAIAGLPGRVTNTQYVTSRMMWQVTDGVHFNAPDVRVLGDRFFWSLTDLSRANGSFYTPPTILFDPEFNDANEWFISGNQSATITGGEAVFNLAAVEATVLRSRHPFILENGVNYTFSCEVTDYTGPGAINSLRLRSVDEDDVTSNVQLGNGNAVYSGTVTGDGRGYFIEFRADSTAGAFSFRMPYMRVEPTT